MVASARVRAISRPLESPALVTAGFGGGVQSSTMLLMAKHGQIEPMPSVAIYSDTAVEPLAVYEHLRFMRSPNVALPFPVAEISAGHLGEDILASAKSWEELGRTSAPRELWKTAARLATPPFYTRGPRTVEKTVRLEALPLFGLPGETVEMIVERHTEAETFGMLRRQCTAEYKIDPVNREIRRLLGLAPGARGPDHAVAEHWIGLTTDELERLNSSPVRFIHLRHPLIELGMSRGDCIEWLLRHGYTIPPKSRCKICPYQSDELWLDMKLSAPEDFEDACRYDEAIRDGVRGTKTLLYLHPRRIPLREVDFTMPPLLMSKEGFRNECSGACGL